MDELVSPAMKSYCEVCPSCMRELNQRVYLRKTFKVTIKR